MKRILNRINIVGLAHVSGIVLWLMTTAILLCIFIVPFLTIDRNFRLTGGFSLNNITAAWDPIMIQAIQNSFVLSVIASLFAIVAGSLVMRLLRHIPFWISIGIVVIYCINPVVRALSYDILFSVYTPIRSITSTIFGEWFAQMILLPAIILGIHYLPIYVIRFLFIIPKSTVSHNLHGILQLVYVQLPAILRGFPISFAVFFLLTFFDYWVIQSISGGKALYWSQLFDQKAFIARNIGEAGMLIILGLLMTIIAYIGAKILCEIGRMGLRRLRPRTVARIPLPNLRFIHNLLAYCTCLLLAWPVLYSVLRTGNIFLNGKSFALLNDAIASISYTIILCTLIAGISTVLAFVFSTLYQDYPRKTRWWLPALYFLALVPEAAYVLFSLCTTSLGVVTASPLWLMFLMISFTGPMSFFLWESLWGESEQRKLWLLASVLPKSPLHTLYLAWQEWKPFFILTFMVNVWMTLDNVFITNYAAGPKWKPMAATIFTATKRGFQDSEFITATVSSVCIILAMTYLATSLRRKEIRIG